MSGVGEMSNNSSGEMDVWCRRCESGDDWRFGRVNIYALWMGLYQF